jgi:hypothetical protein
VQALARVLGQAQVPGQVREQAEGWEQESALGQDWEPDQGKERAPEGRELRECKSWRE